MEENNKLDKAIEQAIRRVGQERDAEDLATLKSFMAKRQQKSKAKKFIMSITSIAAIIAIVFSLNIYQDNRRMDKLFETYYTPLEYDSQLMSRGEDTISPELASTMESYQKEDYDLVSGYTYANAIVPQMEFMSPSKAVAIADNRLMFYAGNEKPVSDGEVMLQETIVSSFYGDGYVGLVHNNADGEKRYRVDIYDESGKKKDAVFFDAEYDEMFFDDGRIVIYNAERCLIHKIGGVEKFNGEFNTPILAMAPTNVADRFILISADGIRTVELK